MRRLIRHSLLNVGAFGVNALAQLALVPLVIGAYGVAALGALALLRLLLPSALLGLLMPGLQTAAVRLTAAAQAAAPEEPPLAANRRLRALTLAFGLAVGVGMALGLALFLPPEDTLARLLAAPPEETAFVLALRPWFAAALPLLYLSLVAQGLLTGLARFALLRALDVSAGLGLLALAALAAANELAFLWILAGFLALQVAKALVFIAAAFAWLRRHRPVGSTSGAGRLLLRELRTLGPSQLVGSGYQLLPPLVVLAVGGAPLLGLYEALRRIPMAIKQLNGMVRTAVLPAAVAVSESPAYRRALAERGSWIVGLAVAPPALTLGVFAAPLLSLWLGPAYAAHAWVFLLFMFEMAVQEMQGVLASAATADLRLVRRETVVRALHLVLLLAGLVLLLRPDDLLPAAILMLALMLAARGALSSVFLPHFALPAGRWLGSQLRLTMIPASVAALAWWASADLAPAWRLLAVAPAAMGLSLLLCAAAARGEERVAQRQTWSEIAGLLRRRPAGTR